MATLNTTTLAAAANALYADGQPDDSIDELRMRTFWAAVIALITNALTSVGQGNIEAGAVDEAAIAALAVTAAKLADGAVTEAKLADAAVSRTKLDDDSVSADAIITSGAHRAGPGLRAALENLTGSDKLPYTAVRGLQDTIVYAVAPNNTYGLQLRRINDSGNLVNIDLRPFIRAQIQSMLTDNTETGITVTYQSDNTIDFVVSGGSTPTAPATLYYGLSADNTFTAAEYTASASATQVTIPAPPADRYLAFAVPDTDNDISYISPNTPTGNNQVHTFERIPGTITLNGVAHKAWRTDAAGLPTSIAHTWYIQT